MLSKAERQVLGVAERLAMAGRFALCDGYVMADNATTNKRVGHAGGFKFVGGGMFSQVFRSAALPNKIVKITSSERDGYHEFVKFVQEVGPTLPEEQRRFLPVIYSSEVVCGVRVTLMEELASGQEALHYAQGDRLLREVHAAVCGEKRFETLYSQDEEDANALFCAMNEWTRKCTVSWDCHSGNVMLRGDQLVVTDPWGAADAPTSSAYEPMTYPYGTDPDETMRYRHAARRS